ncbi:MAG: Crp/Fnr family transcriptional regulator [Myxococcaceae bacterium]|nr:Crp/Fnr family transcriptional regulator [Myxococcaceae bacterium]
MSFRAAFEAISPLGDASWRQLERAAPEEVRFAKGERLLSEGERARFVFGVKQGLLREFYVDQDGGEATRVFIAEGGLSGSLADLLSGEPALVNIEALEPTRVWRVPFAHLQALVDTDPAWARLALRQAQGLYLRKVRREHEMLTMDARARYLAFRALNPGLDSRVPLHLVASYLGITPVHLSRIRGAPRAPRRPPARRRRS